MRIKIKADESSMSELDMVGSIFSIYKKLNSFEKKTIVINYLIDSYQEEGEKLGYWTIPSFFHETDVKPTLLKQCWIKDIIRILFKKQTYLKVPEPRYYKEEKKSKNDWGFKIYD